MRVHGLPRRHRVLQLQLWLLRCPRPGLHYGGLPPGGRRQGLRETGHAEMSGNMKDKRDLGDVSFLWVGRKKRGVSAGLMLAVGLVISSGI